MDGKRTDIPRWVKPLGKVIRFKIGFTIPFFITPLFLFSFWPSVYGKVGLLDPPPPLFAHLLGAAFCALVVGYWRGLSYTIEDRYNENQDISNTVLNNVVQVGIVSNFSACLLILLHSLFHWGHWGLAAQGILWVYSVVLAGISYGLYKNRPQA